MFGLEMLLAPMVGKLVAGVAVVVALVAVYFGIKRKGATAERARIQEAMHEAQQRVQGRVDDARSEDQKIDADTRAKLEEIGRKASERPPERPGGRQVGDRFRFGLLLPWLALALLSACAPVLAPTSVRVDIPSRPVLSACPEAPHPDGVVAKAEDGTLVVLLSMPDAVAVRDYLQAGPACWQSRDVQWDAYATKLENRLKALDP